MKAPRPQRREQVRGIDLGGRVPPHNEEAEAACLSAALSNQVALETVLAALREQDWYSDAHRRIHAAMEAISRAGQPVDVQTVAAWLKDRERLQAIGGISYLAKIIDATPAVAHVAAHCQIVSRHAKRRRFIESCQIAAAQAFGDVGDEQEFYATFEHQTFEIVHGDQTTEAPVLIGSLVGEVTKEILDQNERPERRGGVRSGLRSYDAQTGGFRYGRFYLVAGRPGMGKSALIANMAAAAAGSTCNDCEIGAVVFSLEMPRKEYAERFLQSHGKGVDVRAMVNGRADDEAFARLTKNAIDLEKLPLWIQDAPRMTMPEIQAMVRRIQIDWERPAKYDPEGRLVRLGRKIGLVAIDYLQLVTPTESLPVREQEVSEISRHCKIMAKELDAALLLGCQLNRAVEGRQDKRPVMSDLRESGSLEQDADVITFVYRGYEYLADKESEAAKEIKRLAELILAKQRGGPTGTIGAIYIEEHTRFWDRNHN